MVTWTEEQIAELYERRNRVAIRHVDESLAHKMIAIFQANEYAIINLLEDVTHKTFEKEIEDLVLTDRGKTIKGFSEDRVQADPEAAYIKLMTYLMNRWHTVVFGE